MEKVMSQEYGKLASLTPDEFKKRMDGCFNRAAATKSDERDIQRIENLLDLRQGVLAKEQFYVSKSTCKCGRTLTFYDLVQSGLLEGHSASFVVHTLLGSKYFIQPRRRVKCSACSEVHILDYETSAYGCCN
jgi:hypothetical protein